MKISLQNHKHQSLIIIAIALVMVTYVARGFFKEQTTWQFFMSIFSIGTFSIAVIGAWFRKTWVQYCFFFPAIYSLLASIYSLLALTVRMCCNELNANLAINLFIVFYIIALIYYATAYLARHFFAGQAAFQHNHFTHFLLASGVVACTAAASVWGENLVQAMISDSQSERYNMAVFSMFKSWNIDESWWMLVVSVPTLVLNSLIVFITVFLISRLVGAWTRWHALMGMLYLCALLFMAFGLQYLIGYIRGRGFGIFLENVFFTWGVILVSFLIAGMLATRRRISKNIQ